MFDKNIRMFKTLCFSILILLTFNSISWSQEYSGAPISNISNSFSNFPKTDTLKDSSRINR